MQLRYVDVSVDLRGYDANQKPIKKRIQTEQIIRGEFDGYGCKTGYATLIWDGYRFPNVWRKSFIHEPAKDVELPKNMTEGLRNFVQRALTQVKMGDYYEAEMTLTDLINDIGGAYVCMEKAKEPAPSPVPLYDPKKDGNYSSWLVAHNID